MSCVFVIFSEIKLSLSITCKIHLMFLLLCSTLCPKLQFLLIYRKQRELVGEL